MAGVGLHDRRAEVFGDGEMICYVAPDFFGDISPPERAVPSMQRAGGLDGGVVVIKES